MTWQSHEINELQKARLFRFARMTLFMTFYEIMKITGSKNDWRIRIGDYRVIYEIDEKAKHVRIFRVRHRREAYRK